MGNGCRYFIGGALVLFWTGQVVAGDSVFLNRDASLCDTYRAFQVDTDTCGGSPKTTSPLGATRSIRIREEPRTTPQSQDQTKRISVSVPVLFEFDSYAISPDSRLQLQKIAQVIQDPALARVKIALEGHADASGDAGYNLTLSTHRAAAVRQYFVQQYGMDVGRFRVTGKGESDPYNPQDPTAAENRRVEFIILRESANH